MAIPVPTETVPVGMASLRWRMRLIGLVIVDPTSPIGTLVAASWPLLSTEDHRNAMVTESTPATAYPAVRILARGPPRVVPTTATIAGTTTNAYRNGMST